MGCCLFCSLVGERFVEGTGGGRMGPFRVGLRVLGLGEVFFL